MLGLKVWYSAAINDPLTLTIKYNSVTYIYPFEVQGHPS